MKSSELSKERIEIVFRKIRLTEWFYTLYCRLVFRKFGNNSKVFGRIKVYCPENVELGENCTLNDGVVLNAKGGIFIGDNVRISPQVVINSAKLNNERVHENWRVKIEDNAWLASNCLIGCGVTIGKNAVVGCGAVVLEDVPANSFVCGVPAKIKRKETEKLFPTLEKFLKSRIIELEKKEKDKRKNKCLQRN